MVPGLLAGTTLNHSLRQLHRLTLGSSSGRNHISGNVSCLFLLFNSLPSPFYIVSVRPKRSNHNFQHTTADGGQRGYIYPGWRSFVAYPGLFTFNNYAVKPRNLNSRHFHIFKFSNYLILSLNTFSNFSILG